MGFAQAQAHTVHSTSAKHAEIRQIPSDSVPISCGTLAGDLGGITIWNPWSNESDANLED